MLRINVPPTVLLSLLPLCLLAPTGCNSDPDCDEVLSGDFAIAVQIFDVDECDDYTGRVVKTDYGKDVESELSCQVEEGNCFCRGGDAMGNYDVFLENKKTNQVEFAQFEVLRREAPMCIYRDNKGSFVAISNEGGAGGAGGAGN